MSLSLMERETCRCCFETKSPNDLFPLKGIYKKRNILRLVKSIIHIEIFLSPDVPVSLSICSDCIEIFLKADSIKKKFIEADDVLRNLKLVEDKDPVEFVEVEVDEGMEVEDSELQEGEINITAEQLEVEIKEEVLEENLNDEPEVIEIVDDEESENEYIVKHQEISSSQLTCEVCLKEFQSIRGLYHHFNKYRQLDDPEHPPLHTCKRCRGRFFRTKNYNNHKCILEWRFTRNAITAVKIPEPVVEKPKFIGPANQMKNYNSIYNLLLSEQKKPEEFHCGICPTEKFDDIVSLKQHCRDHRRNNHAPFQSCTTCYREFYSSTLFKTHKCGKVSPTCHYCLQLLNSRSEVYTHMVQKHRTSDETFRCNFENCQHTSLSSRIMFFHLASHYEPLHLVCNICFKIETNYQNFIRHNASHRAQKTNFVCDFCGLVLKTRNSVKRHLEALHKNKRYWCDQCSLHFSTFGILKKHKMNSHGLPSKFECSFCPMKFLYASEFRAHESKHSGSKRSRK